LPKAVIQHIRLTRSNEQPPTAISFVALPEVVISAHRPRSVRTEVPETMTSVSIQAGPRGLYWKLTAGPRQPCSGTTHFTPQLKSGGSWVNRSICPFYENKQAGRKPRPEITRRRCMIDPPRLRQAHGPFLIQHEPCETRQPTSLSVLDCGMTAQPPAGSPGKGEGFETLARQAARKARGQPMIARTAQRSHQGLTIPLRRCLVCEALGGCLTGISLQPCFE